MGQNGFVFSSEGSAGSGSAEFVKDAFLDISVQATSNAGLTDTALTNPLGGKFLNDDAVKYGPVTMWIKDVKLIEDRSKWINSQATYEICWDKYYPGVLGYAYGAVKAVSINGQYVPGEALSELDILISGGGVGITGVFQRVAWLVQGSTSTGTAQVYTDGVSGSTLNFGGLSSDSDRRDLKYSSLISSASNSSVDIHDFRAQALNGNTLKVVGVIVYFENAGADIQIDKGTTYVNKTRVDTAAGMTFPLAAYGSSLGGVLSLYKSDQTSGYVSSAISATTLFTIGQGLSGTNLLNVSTGEGASFPVGAGLVGIVGSSLYVGSVTNVSTDTLTVSPTLPFGISGSFYRAWQAGSTLTINPDIFALKADINWSQYSGLSSAVGKQYSTFATLPLFNVLDAKANVAMYGANVGVTSIGFTNYLYFKGASGFLQVDGRFSAASMELDGATLAQMNISVNGTPGYSIDSGVTGWKNFTLFTDAGPGWNSFLIQPGASISLSLAIPRLALYERRPDVSVTFGMLAALETNQAYAYRDSINASLMALGLDRRIYADQMPFDGPWARSFGNSLVATTGFFGSTNTCSIQLEYYGKEFAVVGTNGSSGTLTLDGSNVGVTFGVMKPVASEAWHTVLYQHQSGTAMISAIDVVRSKSDIIPKQNKMSVRRKIIRLPIITEWIPFTPIWKATGATQPIFPTTFNGFALAEYRRVGDTMEIRHNHVIDVTISGGGDGENFILYQLPNNESFDNNKLPQNGDPNITPRFEQGHCGSGSLAAGGFVYSMQVLMTNVNKLFFLKSDGGPLNDADHVFTVTGAVSFNASVPIFGWKTHYEIEVSDG